MREHVDDDTQDPNQRLPVGAIIAERYRIEALLGEGGMGAVYRAQHVLMQKTFAVKVLHRHMTLLDEAVRRFEREAVAAGRIEHPNVATATDFGRLEDGSFYLVLEFVAGKTLRELLQQEGALPVERALSIARQTALGLGAAHAVSVVHRDLKPDNIMLVARESAPDLVKVLDFGIAQVKGDEPTRGPVTQFGAVFGTPQYMAPEQAAGQTVDQRADLYALGLILDEMLRGAPTFQASELVALLSKQLVEAPPQLPDSIPTPVRALVAQLLQKNVEDRVQSAGELVAKLDELLGIRATLPSSELGHGVAPTERIIAVGGSAPISSRIRQGLAVALTQFSVLEKRVRSVCDRLPWLRMFLEGSPIVGLSRGRLLSAVLAILLVVGLGASLRGKRASLGSPGSGASALQQQRSDGLSGGSGEEEAMPPELRNLLRLARTGNKTALDGLELRADSERSAAEWSALAEGRLKQRQVEKALDAIEHVLSVDENTPLSPELLSGLRLQVNEPSVGPRILNFAAKRLKSDGADLLFNTYAATSLVTEATRQAKELLFSAEVKQHWSEALSIALALRAAESCEDSLKLLDRAVQFADERSLKPLKDLKNETGCGANKRADCYPCLRGSNKLEAAINQAQMNKAPRYGDDRW
ncbi:MAG: protein kinase [Polyangiaceae bacterium]|nr:protein kinase [Polyangiaceae bacterium]